MREVRIADADVVTAAGMSLTVTWQRIMSGTTAIGEIGRFPVDEYRSTFGATIPGIESGGPGSLAESIVDLLLGRVGKVPRDSLVITASTKGGIDNLEKVKRGISSEAADILPSSVGAWVAAKLGLTREPVNVSAACASSTVAIAEGAAMIASGRVESALVCCMDVMTEFIFSGFSALQVLSPVPCKPFDRDRQGLSPGEGAAFVLLMSPEAAHREGYATEYAVAGYGMTNDAFHITTPDLEGKGLVRAINGALRKAGIGKDEIAGISAHGTGTFHNDLMELNAFRTVFGDKCPPVYSIKGCLGHTFGAAGGIEVAVAMRALAEQVIPPTVGFQRPERGGKGVVSARQRAITGDYLLVTNSGFGGINAVVILKKGELR